MCGNISGYNYCHKQCTLYTWIIYNTCMTISNDSQLHLYLQCTCSFCLSVFLLTPPPLPTRTDIYSPSPTCTHLSLFLPHTLTKSFSQPQSYGWFGSGTRIDCAIPNASKHWLIISAREWMASESMAAEPVYRVAATLNRKTAKLLHKIIKHND